MALAIDMSNWVVLITGGSRGVGKGICEQFLNAGADVEFCGRNAPEEPPQVGDKQANFTEVNVRDADAVEAWVNNVAERHGRVDVAVNNVGGSPFGPFEEGSPRYLQALMEVNFFSAAYIARAIHPIMMAQEQGGSLINITSISARRPSPGTALYGAAKAGLESLTGSLAVEWAPKIRVNALSSGLVATEGAEGHYGSREQYDKVAQTIPRGQMANPNEIGSACVFLASPLATHITGAVINIDGGGEWPAFLAHTPNADFITRHQGEAR